MFAFFIVCIILGVQTVQTCHITCLHGLPRALGRNSENVGEINLIKNRGGLTSTGKLLFSRIKSLKKK